MGLFPSITEAARATKQNTANIHKSVSKGVAVRGMTWVREEAPSD